MDAGEARAAVQPQVHPRRGRVIQEQVKAKGVTITKPDATPFRQATASVYKEFYATPAGKDARKMVDYILSIK